MNSKKYQRLTLAVALGVDLLEGLVLLPDVVGRELEVVELLDPVDGRLGLVGEVGGFDLLRVSAEVRVALDVDDLLELREVRAHGLLSGDRPL